MGIIGKVRTNIDKTTKAMVRNARVLPFPEPWWIHDPMAIASILKQQYTQEIRGMIDVYQVGKEEIGSILCVDAEGKGQLLLGRECRGKNAFVVVKDCKPFGISVGTLHTHPCSQPSLSPGDLEVGILNSYFACVAWKDEIRRYWLKAVTFDTYYSRPYQEQLSIDDKIVDALYLEQEMNNVIREMMKVPGSDPVGQVNFYISQLVALCTSIENLLGAYTIEI